MRWTALIEPEEVQRAVSILQKPGAVFEIRVIGTAKKDIFSGYFKDAVTLLARLDDIDIRQKNIYITLGELKEECFARAQSENFLKSVQTTSDPEVERYRWLFVDLDPVRAAGISSSDDELKAAEDLSEKVYAYMLNMGFSEPVRAMSGNGYHLLYRIDIPNTDANQALVEGCLKTLAELFNTDAVKIDTTNSNPSRICKLHGTLAQKGRSTNNRPHRMSRILSAPEDVQITDTDVLHKLVGELPQVPEQTKTAYTQDFDLLSFMQHNGLTYREDSNTRAKIYLLDECPFNPSHKDGDARIFQYTNGAIAFKCHHNSCRSYKWQDLRQKFEPNAYDNSDPARDEAIDKGYLNHLKKLEEDKAASPTPAKEPKKPSKKKKLKTAAALVKKKLPPLRAFIKNDAGDVLLVEGLCLISSKPKVGKSWLVLQSCIAIAQGADIFGYKTNKCATLYLDLEEGEIVQQGRIKKVLGDDPVPDNFYIDGTAPNFDSGLMDQLEYYLEQDPNIGVIAIDLYAKVKSKRIRQEDEYDHVYRDFTALADFARSRHISIILVTHSRKTVDPDSPYDNILGSTALTGATDQMILLERKGDNPVIKVSARGKNFKDPPKLLLQSNDGPLMLSTISGNPDNEEDKLHQEYMTSGIRKAVLGIANDDSIGNHWRGRCSEFKDEANRRELWVIESHKYIGGFLSRHIGRFGKLDGVKIEKISNGTGGSLYNISKIFVDTVDTVDNIR